MHYQWACSRGPRFLSQGSLLQTPTGALSKRVIWIHLRILLWVPLQVFKRAILVHHARLTNFPLTAFWEKIAWIEIVSNSGSLTRCIVSHCAHQVKKMLIWDTMTIRCIHLRNGISRGIRVGLMVYNMGPGSLLQMLFIVALELKGCFIVISIIFLTPKLHSTGADLDGENGYCLFF